MLREEECKTERLGRMAAVRRAIALVVLAALVHAARSEELTAEQREAFNQIQRLCALRAQNDPMVDGYLSRTVSEQCCIRKALGMSVPSACAKYDEPSGPNWGVLNLQHD